MDEFKEVDQLVVEGMNKKAFNSEGDLASFKQLKDIVEKDTEFLTFCMGDFGKQLKKFSELVDIEHPKVQEHFKEGTDEMFGFLFEVIKHGEFAKSQNLNLIAEIIKQAVNKGEKFKQTYKFIINPPARVLKDRSDRVAKRSIKDWKAVPLKGILQKDEDNWNEYPNTFKIYPRYSDFYEKDITNIQEKIKKFEQHGVDSCLAIYRNRIDRAKAIKDDMYCGFHRAKMGDVAIILSRSVGYTFANNRLFVPISYFKDKKYEFWYEDKIAGSQEVEEEQDEYWNTSITPDSPILKPPAEFNYAPRAYPIHQFNVESERMSKIIETLESFHDFKNKPLFDHFWIICPGVNYPSNNKNFSLYLNDKIVEFKNKNEAFNALDFDMTAKGIINPVVLGEVDGKCYFVCYWN